MPIMHYKHVYQYAGMYISCYLYVTIDEWKTLEVVAQ